MPELDSTVNVWVRKRQSYVESHPNATIRVKHCTKLGENLRGFPDGEGELTKMKWENILSMCPTTVEINHSRNPFSQLVDALKQYEEDQRVVDFLSRLRCVSLFGCDVSSTDLVYFLSRLQILSAFSYNDVDFEGSDWDPIVEQLTRLNVRALEFTGGEGAVEGLLCKMPIELLILSGPPGVEAEAIKNCPEQFVTVKTLSISDISQMEDDEADQLLLCLPSKFPRLETLLFDWSVVDPALIADQRMTDVVKQLITVYKELSLKTLAVIAYTPDAMTKAAAEDIAKQFGEQGLSEVRVHRFASKGLSSGTENFSFIVAGPDADTRSILHSVIVENRCSIPDVNSLLQLVEPTSTLHKCTLMVDFAGFESELVAKEWNEKDWSKDIDLS